MRLLSTLCLLLFSSVCFSQIEDLIRKAEYGNTTVKVIPYICGFGRNFSPPPVDLPSLQGEMVRPKDSILLKALQIKVSDIYTGIVNNKDTVKKPETKIVMRCSSIIEKGKQPLYVIDGIPVSDITELKSLDPNDIESINILKEAAASAIFSCRPARGVILITTKSAQFRKFIVKDFLDGSIIPRATVSFISTDKKDTVMMAANDSGIVVADKLKSSLDYEILVSAIGYKLLNQPIKKRVGNIEQELLLERDVKMCDEVVIGGGYIIHCGRNYQCISVSKCSMHTAADTAFSFSSISGKAHIAMLNIYPNPVQKGSLISIETATQSEGPIQIRLTSLDGKLLLSQSQKAFKGLNRFTINTDPRWSAGIYFVQLYANGKLLASDKVVIQ